MNKVNLIILITIMFLSTAFAVGRNTESICINFENHFTIIPKNSIDYGSELYKITLPNSDYFTVYSSPNIFYCTEYEFIANKSRFMLYKIYGPCESETCTLDTPAISLLKSDMTKAIKTENLQDGVYDFIYPMKWYTRNLSTSTGRFFLVTSQLIVPGVKVYATGTKILEILNR